MVAALRGHFPSAHSGSSWLKHDATKACDQARGLPTRPRQPSRRHVGSDVSAAGGAARHISTPPEAACGSATSGILRHEVTTLLDTYDRSTRHLNKIGTLRDACQLQGVRQQHLLRTLHRPDLRGEAASARHSARGTAPTHLQHTRQILSTATPHLSPKWRAAIRPPAEISFLRAVPAMAVRGSLSRALHQWEATGARAHSPSIQSTPNDTRQSTHQGSLNAQAHTSMISTSSSSPQSRHSSHAGEGRP